MSGETVEEVKNEEDALPEARVLRDTEPITNEVIETTNQEQPDEQIKQEETMTAPIEEIKEETQPTAKAKPKAQPKKLARSVKVVELVACNDCGNKMLPKSLKNTHPHYCKGQPTETLPVNKQKASYGSKVEQKLRKEIEEEMKKKYENKENDKNASNVNNEVANASEALPSLKPKAQHSVPSVPSVPVKIKEREPPKQLTARELLEASYAEIRKAKREAHIEKIQNLKQRCFNINI